MFKIMELNYVVNYLGSYDYEFLDSFIVGLLVLFQEKCGKI